MHELPERPDLDQLRRQARELQRAAAGGDSDARERLDRVSPQSTLTAARLAIAREYGFSSCSRLKSEVERRNTRTSQRVDMYGIRPVRSLAELAEVFDRIGQQLEPRLT